jgi:hypothetical protein
LVGMTESTTDTLVQALCAICGDVAEALGVDINAAVRAAYISHSRWVDARDGKRGLDVGAAGRIGEVLGLTFASLMTAAVSILDGDPREANALVEFAARRRGTGLAAIETPEIVETRRRASMAVCAILEDESGSLTNEFRYAMYTALGITAELWEAMVRGEALISQDMFDKACAVLDMTALDVIARVVDPDSRLYGEGLEDALEAAEPEVPGDDARS